MYSILLYALAYSLPALHKVYNGCLIIPLIGKQNIEFERLKENTSRVRLYGIINCNGLVYNANTKDETPMNYELDPYLKNIMTKYRCTMETPYYDVNNDTILFVLKINMLGLTKSIKLHNTK
uniref:Uncharacterized protein n=1 Tax=viral metagenome TaxID=1070528 RepID=A0A6C0KS76_9ZZZZ